MTADGDGLSRTRRSPGGRPGGRIWQNRAVRFEKTPALSHNGQPLRPVAEPWVGDETSKNGLFEQVFPGVRRGEKLLRIFCDNALDSQVGRLI
jgi:hypothetical protein